MSTVPLFIDGKERVSNSTFPVISPLSHKTLYSCSTASPADTDAAIAAATAAFPRWSKTKPIERRTILLKAADLLEKYAEELKQTMKEETGSDEGFAQFNIFTTAEHIRDTAGKISAISGSVPICQEPGRSAMVLKEPYGVILSIAPWNAPYILGGRSIIFPLATGNTVVLKGSELSPRCMYHLGRIFSEAGLPAGALNIVYTPRESSPAITKQLIEAPAIRKINFTGSTAVGAAIAAIAGRALKPCIMELGGKAAAIVLEDADIEHTAMQCVLGSFLHSGQICMSTERIIVHKDIVDKFRPALQQAVAGFSPADAVSPVLAQAGTVARNRALVADAVCKGATVIHGDHTADEMHPETGEPSATRLRPVIVEGVTMEMDLYSVESFGPSVSMIVVESEDEAVEIANDVEYGLNAAVFSKDLARALRVAKRLDSGNIHINSMSVHDEASLPHGGVKASGWGRFNGEWGLDEFLRVKTITFME
ncbi:Clathrin assembly protein [Mycena chlorophos]|uniref:Clathrin assembly protein n=1 Tax=Mycena chlorophos TaxID=658473 RepID=A0A8H6W593_MYCCL|nr:Clathrin assembly protein [Mycena chlorophos]